MYIPAPDSHKGQNGRLLVIGGVTCFMRRACGRLPWLPGLWIVHYCSVPENNEIVKRAKEEFRNGIVVSRRDVENTLRKMTAFSSGPGMTR